MACQQQYRESGKGRGVVLLLLYFFFSLSTFVTPSSQKTRDRRPCRARKPRQVQKGRLHGSTCCNSVIWFPPRLLRSVNEFLCTSRKMIALVMVPDDRECSHKEEARQDRYCQLNRLIWHHRLRGTFRTGLFMVENRT